jgi:hypothetical protein
MMLGNATRCIVNRPSRATDSSYAASPNASDTTKPYWHQDHLAENRFRHLNRR